MLELFEIQKTFNVGTVNEKKALQGINLTINDGDFITVIGGNGAGKSTLLNIISGAYMSDGGKILIDSVDVTNKAEYQRAKDLGRVFQDPMLGTAADMSIEDNLAMAFRRVKKRGLTWGITRAEKERYKELVKTLGLGL